MKSLKNRIIVLFILGAMIRPVDFASAKTTQQKTTIITVDHGAQDPAVSLDGAQIAASIFGKIWVMFIAGGEARQITEGLGWDTHPAGSAHGHFLAYPHQLPSGTDLVIRNLITGGSNTLYHTESAIGQITYHPKGGESFILLYRSQYDFH